MRKSLQLRIHLENVKTLAGLPLFNNGSLVRVCGVPSHQLCTCLSVFNNETQNVLRRRMSMRGHQDLEREGGKRMESSRRSVRVVSGVNVLCALLHCARGSGGFPLLGYRL